MRHLHDLFIEAAKLHPKKYAVIWDAESKVFSVTFAEILAESGHISENLIAAGANGEYVGILIENPMIYPTLMIGVLRSYCAFVPIDLNTKSDWFSTLIRKVNIRFIFTDKIDSLLEEWTLVKHFSVHNHNVFLMYDEKIQKRFGSESSTMAYAIQTSGSTGIPKIIRVPPQSIIPNIIQLRSIFLITAEDTIFLSSPLTFDPSIVEIFVTLSSGASLLTAPHHIRAGPGPVLFEYLFGKSRECCGKVSVLSVTPSYAACLFGSPLNKSIDPALRVLSLGGEPCPPNNTLSEWRKKLGGKTKIFSLYGITEVSCWASVVEIQLDEGREKDKYSAQNKEGINNLDKLSSDSDGMMMEILDLPLGSPLMETMLEVRDSEGNIVREGTGELFVGSETRVCLLDDEDDSIVHKGGPIYRATGDMVRVCNPLKETGPSISYIQRKDEAMKRFGRWVLIKNIETLATEFVWAYQDMKEISIEASCCVSCGKNLIRTKTQILHLTDALTT
ncbi:hypothetical protein J437_LFUL017798 [Ladona fulva]|uniref:AMP-dependent synthetase/ligase domain-containing protein n=1 Tax=Ladona fulva TaxID=123851 RepID=A0A8K0KRM3_LADFU|nr:hypothetical protein J437_LFUL017798 [Ladona fulva]